MLTRVLVYIRVYGINIAFLVVSILKYRNFFGQEFYGIQGFSNMELKMKAKSYYSTIGMKGFREFLISEQSETDKDRDTDKDKDRDTDRELNTVRDKIQRTKKRILFKQLTRTLAILNDKERSTR
jgi:hypothetical protein